MEPEIKQIHLSSRVKEGGVKGMAEGFLVFVATLPLPLSNSVLIVGLYRGLRARWGVGRPRPWLAARVCAGCQLCSDRRLREIGIQL